MLAANPRATRASYPDELKAMLSIEKARESRAWLACWDKISPEATPLRELPGLAAKLGVGGIGVKDESARSVLGSFKALGAPIALVRLIRRLWPAHDLDARGLSKGAIAAC